MEKEIFAVNAELKEKELSGFDLRVNFIRHCESEHSDEEARSARFEGRLTEKGIEQAKARALGLACEIDKTNEIIVFWTSPKGRAKQTADVIIKTFREEGICLIRDPKTMQSLADADLSPVFLEKLKENNAISNWMEYWSGSELPANTESPESVRRRVERVIAYLERIARTINSKDKRRLHFICVGHEEIFRDLLEEGLKIGTINKSGPRYGDNMVLDIVSSMHGKDASMRLSFGGETAELGFNKEKRKFYKIQKT